MSTLGALYEGILGPPMPGIRQIIQNNMSTYAMAALNTGWTARFIATETSDITAVTLYWNSVSAPGAVTLRLETIDTSTGKPTGTLYDANAVMTGIVPAAGLQTYTFATAPTTGLTVGNAYAIVVITTTAGTTQTLRSSADISYADRYPLIVLTAADGTTRSNFAESSGTVPICGLTRANGTGESCGMNPYYNYASVDYVYGASVMAASKITLAASLKTAFILAELRKAGTPAGDLRCRILDSGNNLVTGATVTHNKNYLTGVSTKIAQFIFPSVITLSSGTYRAVFDSSGSANASNAFGVCPAVCMPASAPANFYESTSADGGSTWTDTANIMPIWLGVSDVVASGGGAGGVSRGRLLNSGGF